MPVSRDVLVVVPTLGERPDWLADTIRSIQCQQGVDLEIRVVCPRAEIEIETVGAHPINVIVETQPGLSNAINRGFDDFNGRFCTWIGDDDLLAAGALKIAVERLIESPSSPYVYGRTRYIDETGKTIGVTRPGKLASKWLRYGKDFIPQPGSLLRASDLFRIGGLNVKLRNAMDLEMFIKLTRLGKPVYIPQELSCYRLHSESITVSKGGTDEAEDVRRTHQGRIAKSLYPMWRPAITIIDRIWDILNRRLFTGPPSPSCRYRNVS